MGACHFGLMFIGLSLATSSSVSIVLQAAIPITALLSGAARRAGQAGAQPVRHRSGAGQVILVMWDGDGASVSLGRSSPSSPAIAISLGQVLLKRYGAIKPLTMQAWTAFVSQPDARLSRSSPRPPR